MSSTPTVGTLSLTAGLRCVFEDSLLQLLAYFSMLKHVHWSSGSHLERTYHDADQALVAVVAVAACVTAKHHLWFHPN